MVRGSCFFRCDNCNHRFSGPDIEFSATVLSAPLKCPKCGSGHTYPSNWLLPVLDFPSFIYKKIWKDDDARERGSP